MTDPRIQPYRRYRDVLTALCNLPTAPYCEGAVIEWLLHWAQGLGKAVRVRRDGVGNVHIEYRRGSAKGPPLVIEAHLDHPGFVLTGTARDGTLRAEFRGGVRPSFFAGARAKFWNGHAWLPTKVKSVRQIKGRRTLSTELAPVKEKLRPGTLGMWDLPDARFDGPIFSARVCDDLAGAAAIVCLLEELVSANVEGRVIGLFTRAEEVGFAGVLAVCENGWIPKNARVVGLETSKATAAGGGANQGDGAVIRVGDRTGIFSPGLTHFLAQAAGHVGDGDSSFKYQRRLMDGGTCNSTAFLAYGYDSAAMCLALGNYHNMTVKGEIGWGDGAKAGKGIASETIHLDDFAGMVRILIEAAKRIGTYEPGLKFVRDRLSKMHREEQKALFAASKL
jgi:endoglucanase